MYVSQRMLTSNSRNKCLHIATVAATAPSLHRFAYCCRHIRKNDGADKLTSILKFGGKADIQGQRSVLFNDTVNYQEYRVLVIDE
jgi:hypothetical protein